MIAWIIGIVALLIISLFISDETIESFVFKPPAAMPSKVRQDLTCSDPESSSIFDRYNNVKMESIGSNLPIPIVMRNNGLIMSDGTNYPYRNPEYFNFTAVTLGELQGICIAETDKSVPEYEKKKGNKVFIETNEKALNGNYMLVDVYCCKGELYQPPGTYGDEKKVCLLDCPSNYTKNDKDPTICIRNDSTCTYNSNLSENIKNNWSKTCATLNRQNVNIISTINSISNVVSTFSIQTSTVQSNYGSLNSKLATFLTVNSASTDSRKIALINNYNTNFANITGEYNKLYSDIQAEISARYNTLQADKVKFDTLFDKLGCSNYM